MAKLVTPSFISGAPEWNLESPPCDFNLGALRKEACGRRVGGGEEVGER